MKTPPQTEARNERGARSNRKDRRIRRLRKIRKLRKLRIARIRGLSRIGGRSRLSARLAPLGEFIEECDERNGAGKFGEDAVRGIGISKEVIETKADMVGVSIKPYKLFKPGEFCFVTVTSRNGGKISLACNEESETFIVSSSYIVFRILSPDLLPAYLSILFHRPEFDRYARFHSWGSARETFSFADMCRVRIPVPPMEEQKKAVAAWRGLREMKAQNEALAREAEAAALAALGCGFSGGSPAFAGYPGSAADAAYPGTSGKGRASARSGTSGTSGISGSSGIAGTSGISGGSARFAPLGEFIEQRTERNSDLRFSASLIEGVNNSGEFCQTKADTAGIDMKPYKAVRQGDFAYNPSRINLGSLAYRTASEICIVSHLYVVFHVKDSKKDKLLPGYLETFFRRKEFGRLVEYENYGSQRPEFGFRQICRVRIPVPPMEEQRRIAALHECAREARKIAAEAEALSRALCPALAKAGKSGGSGNSGSPAFAGYLGSAADAAYPGTSGKGRTSARSGTSESSGTSGTSGKELAR